MTRDDGYMIVSLVLSASIALLPTEVADVRCVAVIGVTSRLDPALKEPGAEFAARVGAEIIDRAQMSREAVANLMLAEGLQVARVPPDPAERQQCTERMAAVLVD
jgi:hypothetical protein